MSIIFVKHMASHVSMPMGNKRDGGDKPLYGGAHSLSLGCKSCKLHEILTYCQFRFIICCRHRVYYCSDFTFYLIIVTFKYANIFFSLCKYEAF